MNVALPNSTLTGRLELLEIFEFYDGPKLFGCRNGVDQQFLGYWAGANDVGDIYWLVPTSRERYKMIRSGGVDLFTAISRPELGFLYRCVVSFANESTEAEAVPANHLPQELLPDPGEAISLPTETLPDRFAALDLPRKAIAARREIVGLHFNFPGMREEAPTKQIGNLLFSLQDMLDALGQNRNGTATMRGKIPPEILTRTETRLAYAAGASFAVEILAAQSVNLFDESLITEAVAEFVEILGIGNDVERLRAKLFGIKARAVSKYRAFLSALLAAESPLTLDWSSPNPQRNKQVKLDLAAAAGALKTAEEVTSELGETKTGIGYFVGVVLPRRTFTAIFEGEDDTLAGRISDAAMPAATHVTLNRGYRITIRETLETSASGEERAKYELEKIEEIE